MADYDVQALRAITRHIAKRETGQIPLPSGNNHLGEVGGSTASILVVVPTSAPAYANGDVVGGVLEFESAARVAGGTGMVGAVLLTDTSNQKAPLTIFLYGQEPSVGVYTDNQAPAGAAGDIGGVLSVIQVVADDYLEVGGVSYCELGGIGSVFKTEGGTSVWAVVVSNGTPVYAANSLRIRLGVLRD